MLSICKVILQYCQYSIHSKDLLLVQETSTGQCHNNYIEWCLKQVKDCILKCSISGKFFSEKKVLNLYTVILFFSFRWMCWWGCWQLNKLSRTQICWFPPVSLIGSHQFHEEWMSLLDYQKNYFNVYICLNHSWWCKHNQS